MFQNQAVRLLLVLLSPVYLLTIFISLNSNLRRDLMARLGLDRKILLSTVSGDLLHDGSSVKVLKYQTPEGIMVEILGPMNEGSRPLLDRIEFPRHADSFFDIGGDAARLAVVDIDNDERLELIAPTVDTSLIAHLNAFRYDEGSKKFEPIQ